MFLSDLFRSFRPLHNPLGFGAADFLLLALGVLLTTAILLRALLAPFLAKLAGRTPLAMAVLAGTSVLLRLALLGSSPAPVPAGADDFSYLFLADTLRHARLANHTHPLFQFFEAVFVLQQPTYSSIYPLGQGLVLAAGHLLFGTYWAGVLASVAALSALTFWMLRAWVSPRWAFGGGLLALIQFGPLNQWTNSYWGGAVSACAGCLVWGALPRLFHTLDARQTAKPRLPAVLLGLGLALQLLTRPFEFLLLVLSVFLYLLTNRRSRASASVARKVAFYIALAFLPATALTLLQNKSVTGSVTTLPYMLSRYQYGVPATFTWQPNPVPHRPLTPEQDLDYRAQAAIHGPGNDAGSQFLSRLGFRLRYLRFFWLAPLFLAFAFYIPKLREPKWRWPPLFVALFLAGTNFYPYFFPHYVAALSSLLLLIAVKGLETLSHLNIRAYPAGSIASRLILCLCAAHFLFWYALHLSANENLLPATAFETGDFINFGDPEGRIAIGSQLAQLPGRHLVFVRYSPYHRFGEWIANGADIDSERVVWALDRGSAENENLIRYFPARRSWLLEPDARPPKLTSYLTESTPAHQE